MNKLPILGTLAVVVAFQSIASHSEAQLPDRHAGLEDACNRLATADFSHIDQAPTQIVSTKYIAGKGDVMPYCDVHGYVWPQVGFELQLPTERWNGKFFELGCGGSCGLRSDSRPLPTLRRGFAVIFTDMGHQGKLQDGLWAVDNLQAQIDFGYRSTHVTAVVGKAIVKYFYGRAPAHSYFFGESTGGRQALVEAQRFPWDFDGIIAVSVWIDDTASAMDGLWAIRALQDSSGKPLLNHSALQLVHQAALDKCDLDDGLRDGLISNPLRCKFDPVDLVCRSRGETNCITREQADAVKKVYDGPRNSKGERTFVSGAMPGSEMAWEDWLFVPADRSEALSAGLVNVTNGLGSIMEAWVTEYFRYMVNPPLGSHWQVKDFDFDRDYKRIGATSESLLNAGNPDLRKFKAAGGKLIIIQGWSDPLASIPARTIDYYETSERTIGGREGMQSFARLFMVPGMTHGLHGEGAIVIDIVRYLEDWVEQGQGPGVMIGSHLKGPKTEWDDWTFPLDPAKVAFTRPIYSYPLWAKYKGRGDPNDPSNFEAAR